MTRILAALALLLALSAPTVNAQARAFATDGCIEATPGPVSIRWIRC